jgi:peptidyl-prolyl cis-trans isomerase A (cyclophilin A)
MKTIYVLLIAIVVAGFALHGQPQASAQAASPKAASTSQSAAKRTTATAPPTFNRALLHPSLLKVKAPDHFKARFITTNGEFVIEVHRDWSPLGADRFYNLVKNGFYNNESFFRVVPGFVVQFGLSPMPAVTKAWQDAFIQDDPVTQTNKRGSVTFATSGPNSRTTQLFVNFGENGRLDGMGFSPFGELIEGMDVVDKIYAGYGEAPNQGQIEAEGKTYLEKNFPQLDSIKVARLEGVVETRPAAKKTAAAPAKATTHPANK